MIATWLVVAAWCCVAAPPAALDSEVLHRDFDAALGRLRVVFVRAGQFSPEGTGWGRIPPALRTGCDLYRPEAEALAKAHGVAAVAYLESRLGRWPDRTYAGTLALMTLAALARDQSAADALTRYLVKSPIHRSALIAATYAPAPVARSIGREMLRRRQLTQAATLLRFTGESRDAEALDRAIAEGVHAPGSPYQQRSQQELQKANLAALRQRLAHPSDYRAEWARQDLIVWRACRPIVRPPYRGEGPVRDYGFSGLVAQTRLDVTYLRDRLRAEPISSDELEMVFRAIVHQRESALASDLADLAAHSRDRWGRATTTLLSVGTPEAVAAVKRLVRPAGASAQASPGEPRESDLPIGRRDEIVGVITRGLGWVPSRSTIDLLDVLIGDPSYSSAERSAFSQKRQHDQTMIDSEYSESGMRAGALGRPTPRDP